MKHSNFFVVLSGLLWLGISYGSQQPISIMGDNFELVGCNWNDYEAILPAFKHGSFPDREKRAYVFPQHLKNVIDNMQIVIDAVGTQNNKIAMQFKLIEKHQCFNYLCEIPVDTNSKKRFERHMKLTSEIKEEEITNEFPGLFYDIELVKVCPNVLPWVNRVPIKYKGLGGGDSFADSAIQKATVFTCENNKVNSLQGLFLQAGTIKYFLKYDSLVSLRNLMEAVLKKNFEVDKQLLLHQKTHYAITFLLTSILGNLPCSIDIDMKSISCTAMQMLTKDRTNEMPDVIGDESLNAEIKDFQVTIDKKQENNKRVTTANKGVMIERVGDNTGYVDSGKMWIDQRMYSIKKDDKNYTLFMTPAISNSEYEFYIRKDNLWSLLDIMEKAILLSYAVNIEFVLKTILNDSGSCYCIQVTKENIELIKGYIDDCTGKEAVTGILKKFAGNLVSSISDMKPVKRTQKILPPQNNDTRKDEGSKINKPTGTESVKKQQTVQKIITSQTQQPEMRSSHNTAFVIKCLLGVGGTALVVILAFLYKQGYFSLPSFVI